MINIFKLGWLEYKKNFCKKWFYIWLGILFFIFFMTIREMPEKTDTVNLKPKSIVESIILYCTTCFQLAVVLNSINALLEELRYGTSTFLFTGNRSRTGILFSKILSVLFFGLTLGLINYFFILCTGWRLNLNHKYFFGCGSIIFLYFIYSWLVSNYFLFFSVVFKNRLASFTAGMFFLYILSDITKNLITSFKLPKKFLALNPFLAIDLNSIEFFKSLDINIYRVLIMFIIGLIFFILSALILNKKDLA